MPFMGVRISWLIFARNSLFDRLAAQRLLDRLAIRNILHRADVAEAIPFLIDDTSRSYLDQTFCARTFADAEEGLEIVAGTHRALPFRQSAFLPVRASHLHPILAAQLLGRTAGHLFEHRVGVNAST
jgi:hypothetical protein